MKSKLVSVGVALLLLGMPLSGYGALQDMGDGTIYDTDTQLSWLKDATAGGLRDWAGANAWAAGLNAGSGFAGLTGWRLPSADPTCGAAFNCINGELGHLYYTELGNAAGGPLTNPGPFVNIWVEYWSGTQDVNPSAAWAFRFDNGIQDNPYKTNGLMAWAVRSGPRSPRGLMAVSAAAVTVRNAVTGALVKRVYTRATGSFSVGNLKPGTYTLTITKHGYTFPASAPITVGPSSAGNVFVGTRP